ncbi:T9SS type A sorting domain-containing protein [Candidatus Poribacteria bacterium]|nr:T9SS type A sorting domain-containing protein [Candidatus Poribacteria bacterium]
MMKTALILCLFLITISPIAFLPHTASAESTNLHLLDGVQFGSVAFSPDGQALAGSGPDNIVRLWDVHTGVEKRRFIGHTREVPSVVFSPDSQIMASGSYDNTVRLWDMHTGVEIHRLTGHTSGIIKVVFSPDGKMLASSSYDTTVRLWDIHTGDERHSLIGHTSQVDTVIFSPDGQTLASASLDVRLWDVQTGIEKHTFTGHTHRVNSIDFSPDGQTIASCSFDEIIYLWDVESGIEKRRFIGHEGWVLSLSFSPDGQTLASGSDDGIRFWDVESGAKRSLTGYMNAVFGVAFSPDGQTLAGAGLMGNVSLWDVHSGAEKQRLTGHIGLVRDMVFSPDGTMIASTDDERTLLLWKLSQTVLPQDTRPNIRMIYFVPRDRDPQQDIDEKMDRLIKDVQQFYADRMEAHGFGRKSFQFETDANGNAVVHHIVGRNSNSYYNNLTNTWDVWKEIGEQFDVSENMYYLAAIDMSSEILNGGSACGLGVGGYALMPASGRCFNLGVAAHELGHAFGLYHDFRGGSYLMSYNDHSDGISKCAAEWLNVHRAFNTEQTVFNERSSAKMLSPSLAAPPNAIRLRFEITDPDGIHQAQLLTPTVYTKASLGHPEILTCQQLNGNTSSTIEFITTGLAVTSESVSLHIIDVQGNIWRSKPFPIDVSALLPPPEVVSISDPQLASVLRNALGLPQNASLTQLSIANIRELNGPSRHIEDLTGLEHATNLVRLDLGDNKIADISALTELTQLLKLQLWDNNISDISPLAELTQLTMLNLNGNNFTDISPLAELTQLTTLELVRNNLRDISPLAALTQLTTLELSGNEITDISPLTELTQLTKLRLFGNNIRDISPLVNLNLTSLEIRGNPLSNESIRVHIPAMQAKGVLVYFDYIIQSDDNNTPETATQLTLNTSLTEEIYPGDDIDYFSVEVEQPGQLKLWTTGSLDTIGKLENSEGDILHSDDDDGEDANFSIVFDASSGTYYLRVESNERITGDYTLYSEFEKTFRAEDVNRDGVIDVEDLILVAASFGTAPAPGVLPNTDVNGDGKINNEDTLLVLAALEAQATADAPIATSKTETLQRYIDAAKQLNRTNVDFQNGIVVLDHLLATWHESEAVPEITVLLPNYPNPFNPETWIPYQLATSSDVSIAIYATDGKLIRTLDLGHRAIGIYQHRSRAAYWDGKNAQGEVVASGVYFYTFTAGKYTATRKMLIRK